LSRGQLHDFALFGRGALYTNNNLKGDETMREKIAFQTNVPMTVALAYPDGLQVEGRFGDQIMYTLTDERVMYVPPVVRNEHCRRDCRRTVRRGKR
jgi:hypothetical protein